MSGVAETIDVDAALAFVDALKERWDAEEFERLTLGGLEPTNREKLSKSRALLLRTILYRPFGPELTALDVLQAQRELDELRREYPDV
jgi:hypothetical protein